MWPVGVVALVAYFAVLAKHWGSVVQHMLPLSQWWARAFGLLLGFYLVALASGIPVVVWKYDRLSIAVCLFIVGLLGIILSYRTKQEKTSSDWSITAFVKNLYTDHLLTAFIACGALFAFFIFHARTGVYILSPWDALSSFTLMLFFALTWMVAKMVFSKRSVAVVLGVVILFSYLTHLYLPVVYETGFGGDKWRHLGAERWLQEGNIYTPSIWGEERSVVHFGPLAVPEALVAGNKTSYAAQWATTIWLAESVQVDLFWVDLLLVFLLWSLFIPLLLFLCGRLLFENDRLGLLFAFLPTLFYTFQSEGAITIPVSFGHLFFFFVFLLWMYYAQTGNKKTYVGAILFTLFFYWGYILNFFVLIGTGILTVVYRKLFIDRSHWVVLKETYGMSDTRLRVRDYIIFGSLVFVSVLMIPFLEMFQGLSAYLPGSVSATGVLDSFADSFGRLSGFIGVVVPPDFIDQGNFLYNQTKESLSRLPLFSYRIVPFVVSMAIWTIIAWAVYRLYRYHKEQKVIALLSIIFGIALGSYFISWSFTEGVHILARRLNETIVFFMILFLGYGIWLFLEDERIRIIRHKKIIAVIFVLAFSATSTFASGPKLQLVTADELHAAQLVWNEHKDDPQPYCVLANTWPLLGLEAVSGRNITAGNFPVYHEYAQPERVKLFEGMSKAPEQKWIDGAFAVTNASVCYYMTENRWINDMVLDATVRLLGEPRRVGTVYVWRIEQ